MNKKDIFNKIFITTSSDFMDFYINCSECLDIVIFDLTKDSKVYISEHFLSLAQSFIFLAPDRKIYLKILNNFSGRSSAVLFKPVRFSAILDNIKLLLPNSKYDIIYLNNIISVDLNSKQIYKNSKPIFLTLMMHKLFFLFVLNIGRLVTFDEIELFVYNNESVARVNIQNLVGKLKRKLKLNIQNIYGSGYVLYKKFSE